MTTSSHDGAQREIHAWDRMAIWDWLFVASVTVPALATVLGGDQPWSSRLVTLGLLAAVAGAYAWLRRLDPQRPEGAWPYVVYFAGALVASAVLLRREPTSFFLFYSLYPQAFIYLGRWRLVGVAALTLMPMIHFGGVRGMLAEPGNAISFLGGMALAFAVGAFIDQISQQSLRRQEALDALERARAELAASERTAGILSERQRLAREIHDTLAQGFTSIVMQLEAAEQALGDASPTAQRHLDAARRTARRSLVEVRRSVEDLRPSPLDGASLAEALRQVADDEDGSTAAVTVSSAGAVVPLRPEIEVALVRAAQEALANVRRHAAATRVDVTLMYMDDAVALDVRDDGRGFDPARPPAGSPGGFGLVAMRDRIATLGGSLTVESAPGVGTTVAVSLPLAPPQPAHQIAPSAVAAT